MRIIKPPCAEHIQIVFASNLGGSEGPGGSTWLFIDLSNCEFALQLVTHSVCFTNFVVGKQVKKSL